MSMEIRYYNTPAHSHLKARLRLRHCQWHLWLAQDHIEPHAVLIMASYQAQGFSLFCYCARLKVLFSQCRLTICRNRRFREVSGRAAYLRIVDCLHPMIPPGDLVLVLVRVRGGKGGSTRKQHRAVRIRPTIPPFVSIKIALCVKVNLIQPTT